MKDEYCWSWRRSEDRQSRAGGQLATAGWKRKTRSRPPIIIISPGPRPSFSHARVSIHYILRLPAPESPAAHGAVYWSYRPHPTPNCPVSATVVPIARSPAPTFVFTHTCSPALTVTPRHPSRVRSYAPECFCFLSLFTIVFLIALCEHHTQGRSRVHSVPLHSRDVCCSFLRIDGRK